MNLESWAQIYWVLRIFFQSILVNDLLHSIKVKYIAENKRTNKPVAINMMKTAINREFITKNTKMKKKA